MSQGPKTYEVNINTFKKPEETSIKPASPRKSKFLNNIFGKAISIGSPPDKATPITSQKERNGSRMSGYDRGRRMVHEIRKLNNSSTNRVQLAQSEFISANQPHSSTQNFKKTRNSSTL